MSPQDPPRARREPALPSAPRRRLPVIGAIAVLIAFGAAIWYAYTMGKDAVVDAEVPLIAAPAGPIRTKPEDPGGLQVPNRDKLVYEQLLTGTPAKPEPEQLLPPPEQPVDRPPPPPAEPVEEPGAGPGPGAGEGITSSPLPPPDMPAQPDESAPPAVERTPALPPEEKAPPEPPPPPAAAEAPKEKPATRSGGNWRVQIASLRSEEEARIAWDRARKANQDLLGRLQPTYERVDLGARGVYHRVQAGPLSEKTLADMLCSQLKARNVGCIVVAP